MLNLSKDLSDLIHYDAKTGAVSSRESRHLEFKQGFIAADFSDYTKILASFCNTNGGLILFGVSDKPRTIIGSEEIPDEAKWADRLRADFDPEIPFAVREYKALGKSLYAVGVDPIPHKPVLCKKGEARLSRSRRAPKRTFRSSRRR